MNKAWSPEHVVSKAQAVQLIQEQFPCLSVSNIKPCGEGFDNTVFKVNDAYVFRFPRRELGAQILAVENRFLPLLVSKLSITIPEPLFFGKPSTDYPWIFTGYRFVPGELPRNVSLGQRISSASILAKFLQTLHELPISIAQKYRVPFDRYGRLNIPKRKQQLQQYLQQLKSVSFPLRYHQIENIMNTVPTNPPMAPLTVVHGDLHCKNILVDSSGTICGIIDWGDVHIGHPAVDLSIVYSFLPPEGRKQFFAIYGNVPEETQRVAQFIAIYVAVVLLSYGYDYQDEAVMKIAKDSISLALMTQ
ncbi:phosphotransferase [Thermoflavimicrobium dichotomicum]|uniref:Predicted kinase, aminoglycoside phosphotransferase (APT) family n=1 Tax=Thermoflavimicrobium dichotomicum TaxID=46223 RepID=A0A1I3UAF3_9BACL|nr:phosphotransferase [Thermoflavimicrobium dichotomicum]SFJ80528.1 Predicted kinase, aminoglycoside phosphotransferase (APT) family [Thermoflavimicrobium dichotomicum]